MMFVYTPGTSLAVQFVYVQLICVFRAHSIFQFDYFQSNRIIEGTVSVLDILFIFVYKHILLNPSDISWGLRLSY